MLAPSRKRVIDVAAWFSNVSTSVIIVFVNKVLMSSAGYGFQFATTLSALHFLACTASIWTVQAAGWAKSVSLPWSERVKFAAIAGTSIASLNLSLLLNTVGIYQVAKLLIIPFVCVVEWLWLGRSLTTPALLSVLTVVIGVATVTVNDISVRASGLVVAAISIVTSGMQQIMCGRLQTKWKMSSHELLSNTAPVQGIVLLMVGPFVDNFTTGSWVHQFVFTQGALNLLIISSTVAVGVNLSQFLCLGRFTALSFQVLGHFKTILVLLGGWFFMNESIALRQVWGMILAVSGMIAYGITKAGQVADRPRSKPKAKVKTKAKAAQSQNALDSDESDFWGNENQGDTGNRLDIDELEKLLGSEKKSKNSQF